MSKVKISKEFIKNFSIAAVKDHEGCPEALTMLYKRYGDEVADLSKRKPDFVKLINEDNKPHWAMNFILNLMKEEYRFKFYEDEFEDCVYLLGDKKIAQDCLKAFQAIKKSKVEDYPKLQKMLADIVNRNGLKLGLDSVLCIPGHDVKVIYFQSYICESLMMLMEDDKRVFTRSMVRALSKLADGLAIMDIDNARDNVKMKALALKLVDYSEVFKE